MKGEGMSCTERELREAARKMLALLEVYDRRKAFSPCGRVLRAAIEESERAAAQTESIRESFDDLVTYAQEGEEFTDPVNDPDRYGVLKVAEDALAEEA